MINKHTAFDNLSIIQIVSESIKNNTFKDLRAESLETFHRAVNNLQEDLMSLLQKSTTQEEPKELGLLREWLNILKLDISDAQYNQCVVFLDSLSSIGQDNRLVKIFSSKVDTFLDRMPHRNITALFEKVLGDKESTLVSAVEWLNTENHRSRGNS
jgi:hypothetical protein